MSLTASSEHEPARLTGLPLLAFGALSLLAFLGARGLTPSLRGSGLGLDRCLDYASFVSACASQLVAAGGIALCLRLSIGLLALPALGIAYRLTLVPTSFGVILLVAAAVTQPLNPSSSTWLSLAAFGAPAATLPFLFSRRALRALGWSQLAFSLGAALDLTSYAALHQAALANSAGSWFTLIAANGALLSDAAGVSLAVTFAAGTRRGPLSLWLAASALLLALGSWGGFGVSGSLTHWNHRLLVALARSSPFAYTSPLAELVAVLLITGSIALLWLRRESAELRVAVCLCLLGRLSAGTPIAALLCVTGALLFAKSALNPHTSL